MVWHRNECINLLIIRKICTCVKENLKNAKSLWIWVWFTLCVSIPHRDSEGRKLCKKVKVDPSSKRGRAELLHYKWVTSNSAGCQTLLHTSVLFGKWYRARSLRSALLTVYSWCWEHCVPRVFQRWDIPHRVQQACYFQGQCSSENLHSLHVKHCCLLCSIS